MQIQVQFISIVKDDNIVKINHRYSIYFLNLTVLEMMANKIPLIMTRINGLDELLSDEECIFINPHISCEGDIPFSIEELTCSILSLAADKERRTRLAAKSYRSYERRFTAEGMAEAMHKLFYSLIKYKKPVEEYETGQGR